MNWTRPQDLHAQIQRLWDRGELLGELASGPSRFPRRLTLKCPTSSEMMDRFDEVRAWIAELRTVSRCRIEMREFSHRVFGTNAVPQAVWVDHVNDAFALLGKGSDASRFRALVNSTGREPALTAWLSKKPLRALELSDEWERLLDVVAWVRCHPCSGIYLRQVDIPGVDSKFIESHLSVLSELLGTVLPQLPGVIGGGSAQFIARYGFRDKPIRIRFRELDASVEVIAGVPHADIALDAASFAALKVRATQVFITENEINFLAFPKVSNSLVVFGAGYGWDAMLAAQWLQRCTLFYWGDIDTHGFAILNQLRAQFSHVESFLMDRSTLMAHKPVWGKEVTQVVHDLSRLNDVERQLFDELRDNKICPGLRLEQELITFGWLQAALGLLADETRLDA